MHQNILFSDKKIEHFLAATFRLHVELIVFYGWDASARRIQRHGVMTEPQTNNNDDRTTTYRQVNVEWRHRAADERFSQLSLAYMQPAGWKQLSRAPASWCNA